MQVPVPSPRNFDIYYAVEDHHLSLRDVAALYEISPQRVQEIVQQVERWYLQNTPQWAAEGDLMTRALVAFRRHDERCKYLYDRAMNSFEASIGDQSTSETKLSDPRGAVSKHRVDHGDSRYLTTAMRISRERFLATAAMAKLAEPLRVLERLESEPPSGVLAQAAAVDEVVAATVAECSLASTEDAATYVSASDNAEESAPPAAPQTDPWRATTDSPSEAAPTPGIKNRPLEPDANAQATGSAKVAAEMPRPNTRHNRHARRRQRKRPR